ATAAETAAPAGRNVALFSDARKQAIESFERAYLEDLMQKYPGKVAQAAQAAGLDRVYLYRLLRKQGVKGAWSAAEALALRAGLRLRRVRGGDGLAADGLAVHHPPADDSAVGHGSRVGDAVGDDPAIGELLLLDDLLLEGLPLAPALLEGDSV